MHSLLLLSGCVISILTGISTEQATNSKRLVVNPHNFKYRLNSPEICSRGSDVLLWIHSSPDHFRNRIFIRNTWGNPKNFIGNHHRKVSLVFFLGMSTNKTVQVAVEYERELYSDIVQETFLDSYQNLTYKAIMGCKWTSHYCKSAAMIVKTDDDAFVDTTSLFNIIDKMRSEGRFFYNTLLCHVWSHSAVRRSGKWKVTLEQYSEKFYPPYCSGLGLAMTADLPMRLYKASLQEPFFWIDDAYLTGFLGQRLNVTFENLADRYNIRSSMVSRDTKQDFDSFIFYHTTELAKHNTDKLLHQFYDVK